MVTKGCEKMNRWNQMEKQHKRFKRLVIGFIIFVFVLTIISYVFYGFITYKLVENPEMIGEWINKLITSSLEGTK